MFAYKSRVMASLILIAALTLPATAFAHGSAGAGHGLGGMGHGGMGFGHGWHHGWNNGWGGWSWTYPIYDYPSSWDGGNANWQQGYYTALAIQQAQWAAQQQRAVQNQHPAQKQAGQGTVKASAKRQAAEQAVRSTLPSVTPEEQAAGKLKLANLLADAGKTADAAEFYTDIVKKYPDTSAAKLARDLLGNSGKANAQK